MSPGDFNNPDLVTMMRGAGSTGRARLLIGAFELLASRRRLGR
jgi:hypothetical protein